jgi:hypothetical protein
MTDRVDKDSLPLNQPRRTPSHPTKSHIVKTKVDGKEKIIRFGEQGASTAGKPKEGESDRMKAKRASFKSRHAKNIAKGPSSPAYWANKVKWADGGFVKTNYYDGGSMRAQPQNAALGSIAEFLKQTYSPRRTQQMQGTMEFLGVPALARTAERLSYGQPITNVNKANVPLLPDDTAEAAMLVAPMAGPLGRVAKKTGVAGARMVGEELNRAILDNSGPLAKLVPQAAKPKYIVPPQGNLNLTPMARSEILKGPEAQTPESFLNQLRGKPGMTQEGFDDLVKQYQGLEPNTRMTKAEFEQRIPPSQYNKVDLFDQAGETDAHWLTQAEDMVRQDQSEIYGNMLDRLGAKFNNTNIDLLERYYNKNLTFEELSPDLKKALTRAEANTPEKMHVLDDLYAEERDNSITNTYEMLRERMQDEASGYQGIQRLLENPDRSAEGYFELGVTHPNQTDTYKHYASYRGDDGLIGHVRGTFIPADAADETRKLINPILSNDEVIFAKPNSMVIEEIQSDAQKGKAQSGALRQAHGTMFKAAIQHALEGGVDTVYYPTAKTIGGIRLKESSAYAPIYDQQIIKEGLKPLLKIPGVNANKIGDAYYEINFTPEAKDFILKGEGQSAPGYAGGGFVKGVLKNIDEMVRKHMAKEAAEEVVKAAPKEQKMLQGFYRGYAGDYDATKAGTDAGMVFVSPQRGVGEIFANKRAAQTGTDPHLEMILADPFAGYGYGMNVPLNKQNQKIDFTRARQLDPKDVKERTQLYAEGGSVSYDPSRIEQIMSSISAPQNYAEGGSARVPTNLHPDVEEALKAGRITPNQARWMSNLANTPGNPEIGTAGIRDGVSEKMMNYMKAVRAGEYTRPHWMEPIPKEVKMPKWFSGSVDLDREGLRQLDKIPGLTKQAFKASEYSNTYPVGAGDLSYYRELLQGLEKDPTYQPYLDEIAKVKQRNPKFAEGGSVSVYDSGRVDAIVNQFM